MEGLCHHLYLIIRTDQILIHIVQLPNKEKTYLISVTVLQHKVKPNPKRLPAHYTVYDHHMDGVLCHLYIHLKY